MIGELEHEARQTEKSWIHNIMLAIFYVILTKGVVLDNWLR